MNFDISGAIETSGSVARYIITFPAIFMSHAYHITDAVERVSVGYPYTLCLRSGTFC
jgi:hypothetical protein